MHPDQTSNPDEEAGPLVGEGDSSDHPLKGRGGQRFEEAAVVELPSGLPIPSLGLGTWQLDSSTARDMVAAAIELGVRHIDTAQMYGNEGGVGAGIADAGIDRGDLFLTTKVDNANHEPSSLVDSVHRSLAELSTDHVDLLLVHWPTGWGRMAATLDTLAQVQAAGLAHHIGVSNFTIDQLAQIEGVAPLEVLQVECHPFFQQPDLRQWCHQRGWALTAYSPLAQGEVLDDDVLNAIADDHGTSPATVALAWLLSLDGVVAIPRTSDRDHLAANVEALELRLTDSERSRIADLDAGRRLVDPEFAPW